MRPNRFVQPVGGTREGIPVVPPPPQAPPETLNDILRTLFGSPEHYWAMQEARLDKEAAPVLAAIWDKETKKRMRLDEKNRRARLKTFNQKIATLVREFHRLRQTQGMQPVTDDAAVVMLQGTALELFAKQTAHIEAVKMVGQYYRLVLERDNLAEDRGTKVTGADDKTVTGHRGDGPTQQAIEHKLR